MVDADPEARDVAIRNMPDVPFVVADLHKLSGADLKRAAGMDSAEQVHVLVGGPPCQGFSRLGKGALEDERNVHLVDFLRFVRELRPYAAVMENVPLIITAHNGEIIREVIDGFADLGYATCADVIIASDFGVPQLRKRAFVLAYRGDLGIPPRFPARSHERVTQATLLISKESKPRIEAEKKPYVSVEQAIGDLPPLASGKGEEFAFYSAPAQSDFQHWARQGSVGIFNHRSRSHAAAYLKKISIISEGGSNQELPDDQRFSDNYFSQAYARLDRYGIAQTVTTYFSNPGSGRFMHYRDLRSITVREAARFQAFPDTFVFDSSQLTQMKHVGNAVPPLLAAALRTQVASDLAAAGVTASETRQQRQKKAPRVETPEQRSRIMRAVPAKNTSAEVGLRKALWAAGLRGYRLHDARVPGNPDVVFPSAGIAVFVDGCFWHGCEKCYRAPKSNARYWSMKVRRNHDRDERVNAECVASGWKPIRLWEHDILKAPARAASKVVRAVRRASRRPKQPGSPRRHVNIRQTSGATKAALWPLTQGRN